ncbi:helix-turn-helix transcriptional regulator [Hyphomicrobium sp. NDB2Meth4]|uniref:helix-turn-helix domain-containing protein n=1 Tax=Hyphomicrobium sp. NDB2Meth4 TaxID=1892846 RepID=UPI000930B9C7|nr:helix-turn-helix transcriptional regulator [Hyphomicrobium sp. NDB2Meth4]
MTETADRGLRKRQKRSSPPRSPGPIDRHVGRQLRLRRIDCGLSQSALAAVLGVSFQQIQKYEKGTNRLSAGHLFELAQLLSCSPNDFFAKPETVATAKGTIGIASDNELALVRTFRSLDRRSQEAVLALASSLL